MTPAERLRAAIEPLLPIDGIADDPHLLDDLYADRSARFWLGAIWCELRSVPKGCVSAGLWQIGAWQSFVDGSTVVAPVVQKTEPLWLREVEAMAELLRRVRQREAER